MPLRRSPSARRHASPAGFVSCAPTALAVLAFVGVVASAAPSGPVTTLVSVNAAGTAPGDGASEYPKISADGRFVAFESHATDLVDGDGNETVDVFLRDLRKGTTTLISAAAEGNGAGNDGSDSPALSANGRYVGFISGATNLVSGGAAPGRGVYVRDVRKRTTTLVAGDAQDVSISANGRWVAFISTATDLVTIPTGGRPNVFVRDLVRGSTTLVSVSADGTAGADGSLDYLSISANGRHVAFESRATNLVAEDTGGRSQLFVRDLKSRRTTVVSVRADGQGASGGNGIGAVSISANGRWVAFESRADDLAEIPTGGRPQTFVRDLVLARTTLVSVDAGGTAAAAAGTYASSISANGRYVTFSCDSGDLVGNDANGTTDVFVRDLRRRSTTLTSVNAAGTGGGNDYSEYSSISGNGRLVAFHSAATDLVATHAGTFIDVFVRAMR